MRPHANRARRLIIALALACGLAGVAGAEPGEAPEEPTVPLDVLLRIPDSAATRVEIEKRGGSTRGEWETRFRSARDGLQEAEAALEQTREKLEERASQESAWNVGAPGLGAAAPEETPLDFQLGQQLRRQREEDRRARRRLQALEVEANLAGVPEAWRALPETGEPTAPE